MIVVKTWIYHEEEVEVEGIEEKGGAKSKYKFFKCHKVDHFNKDCTELGNNDNSAQFVVVL